MGGGNLIKELLIKHLINYSPGYVREEMEEQPMVDNPKIRELKKQKVSRVSVLHKLKSSISRRDTQGERQDQVGRDKEKAN